MRILEALRILEQATLECKLRQIDTLEVRQALDLLHPLCWPPWFVQLFRDNLKPTETADALLVGAVGEGQQQQLRVAFSGIYANVRWLMNERLGRLGARYCRTRDPAIKAEIERLNAEVVKLPEEWKFVARHE
jgi:hypothetical protein